MEEELSATEINTSTGADGKSNSSTYADHDKSHEITTDTETDESHKPPRGTLRKVPLLMRNHENNKGVFDPKVVSIGPYHHGKEELQLVEKVKPMVAELLLSNSGTNLNEMRNKVEEKGYDYRGCYVELDQDGSTINAYSREKFTEMMLLDGCFVLGYIKWFIIQGPEATLKYNDVISHLGQVVWYTASVDIWYLLENQLPFQVLELLMSLIFKHDDQERERKMIEAMLHKMVFGELIDGLSQVVRANSTITEYKKQQQQPLHLLQLLWHKLCHSDEVNQPLLDHNLKSRHDQKERFQYFKRLKDYSVDHLRQYFTQYRVKKSEQLLPRKSNFRDYIPSFRSVTELKAKGIHFRPCSRSGRRFEDAVKFKSFCFYGVLELPHFTVGPVSKMSLSNMIAYELSLYNAQELFITSYIGFLKSLIDHPDDVKELRSKHILFNNLGSDEEVTNVFKELTTFSVRNLRSYEEVKQSIEHHYNSKAKTWIAELINKYLSSPWTVIAFIAATSLLVLSFIQTYFAIFPRSSAGK